MNVKEQLLNYFENNIGECISGAKIASELGVSRNAVWKAVKILCEEGYSIESVSNKGYIMNIDKEIISSSSVAKFLSNPQNFDIEVIKSVTSTNTVLKEEAANGEKEGKVLIALEQTMGKGRMGRTFFSPSDTGIYMSILLRPAFNASDSLFITTAAAVAVAKAIEDIAPVEAKIKWVNDIYCDNKKVCGILTEASINVETAGLEWAVLGIGINITKPKNDFPDDIKNIAASIFDESDYNGQVKSKLAAGVINYFWEYYENIQEKLFMEEYRNRSCVIGKEIRIIERDKQVKAKAIDIDNEARLIVELEDGTIKKLSSGEISIRTI